MIIIDSLEEWRKICNIIRFVLVADDVDYSTLEEQTHSLLKILVRSSRFVEMFIIIIRANSIVYFVEYIVGHPHALLSPTLRPSGSVYFFL